MYSIISDSTRINKTIIGKSTKKVTDGMKIIFNKYLNCEIFFYDY